MTNKLVVIGDTHFTVEEPFLSAQKYFMTWFLEQEFNNDSNSLLSLGDWFDKSKPSPRIIAHTNDFLNSMKFSDKTIIAGNHDYQRNTSVHSIEALSSAGMKLILKPKQKSWGKIKAFTMPFFYDNTLAKHGTMKEFYETMEDPKVDYIFGHIHNRNLFGAIIDISHMTGEKCMGHVHIHSKGDDYLGTPYITRMDEKHKESKILLIDKTTLEKTYITVPKFFDYYDCEYNELPETEDTKVAYITVKNVPVGLTPWDHPDKIYDDFIIKSFSRKILDEKSDTELVQGSKSRKEFLDLFLDKTKPVKKVREFVQQYYSIGV